MQHAGSKCLTPSSAAVPKLKTSHSDLLTFRPIIISTLTGKSLYDGARSFLESRQIYLQEGSPAALPDWETICGLGNRKNAAVNAVIAADGVEAFPGTVALARYVRQIGMKTAVVTASTNCELVLRSRWDY